MAIIVLGIGAIMVLAGAGEIYYGSGYIEIERGWSAFIAGTILLTGGLLTLALGLALRSLGEMKGVLLQLGRSGALAVPGGALPQYALPEREAPVALHAHEPTMALDGPAPQIEPHFGLSPGMTGAADAPLVLRDDDGPRLPPAAAAPPRDSAEPPAGTGPHDAPAHDEPMHAEYAHGDGSPEFGGAGEQALHGWPDEDIAHASTQPHAGEARPDHARPDYPDEEPHAGSGAAQGEPHHHDTRATTHQVEVPPHAERMPIPPPAQPIAAEPAPAIAPPSAPSTPPVIGRYESDGTSYVMYADGSIEAQSEAGIYRFASMAELKAFIET